MAALASMTGYARDDVDEAYRDPHRMLIKEDEPNVFYLATGIGNSTRFIVSKIFCRSSRSNCQVGAGNSPRRRPPMVARIDFFHPKY